MEILRRGLPDDLVDALRDAYQKDDWWTHIVNDPEVFVAPRKSCVCVYYRGNCLLRLAIRDGKLIGSVHYKYLLKPELKPTYWNAEEGQIKQPDGIDPFISDFSDLDLVKRASRPYALEEKQGVSEIIRANPNIIDVEIALGDSGDLTDEGDEPAPAINGPKARHNSRVDFVAVQDGGKTLKLVFFEAKHFGNLELRASTGEPRVVKQIERYANLLKKHEQEVIYAYRRHCADMLKSDCIPKDSERRKFLSKVTVDAAVELDSNPRLVVFGFDADEKAGPGWKPHKDKLGKLLDGRVFLRGNAKGLVRGVRFREP
ncbi:MAG: hypothetical protein WAO35_25735 [Terriglobia bacterium]